MSDQGAEQVHADRPLTCALIAEVEYGLIVETGIGVALSVRGG